MHTEIKALIQDYYQIQKHRVEMGNQLAALKKDNKPTNPLETYYERLYAVEKDIAKYLASSIKEHVMWKWLKTVKGIGPILASSLLTTIDITKADHVSSIWKYAGLAPDQKRKKGEKINFNPFLKKTCWLIGESFVKTKGEYRKVYDASRKFYDEKFPHEVKEKNRTLYTKGHKYAMAKRRAVKLFLSHFWTEWRTKENLPVSEPWSHRVASLGK